jgi:hypothetical protein
MGLIGALTSLLDWNYVADATIEELDDNGNEKWFWEKPIIVPCQFKPTEISVSKSVNWTTSPGLTKKQKEDDEETMPLMNAPDLYFAGGSSAGFSLDLFFDTTREKLDSERDVRKYTNRLLLLTMMRRATSMWSGLTVKPPPLVRFKWGKFVLFRAVITSVNIRYTLFHANGTPARAEAKVDFKQFDPTDDKQDRPQNPTTRTETRRTRLVRQGDRLDLIAHQEYGESGQWRLLAEANNILDPLGLEPGQILVIPPPR